jgi:glycosyltransferase involved in cell wall biosynthesis
MFVEPDRTIEPRVRELGIASSPRIVVVIPAFNEEQAIASAVLTAEKFADVVIICDDGSRDMTAEIAKKLGAEVVVHRRNLGYGTALLSLFIRANELAADVVVTFDGDGQHDARFIPDLIAPIINGQADVVIGSRFKSESRDNTSSIRKVGIRMINALVQAVSRKQYSDTQSGMRAYRAEVLKFVHPSEAGMGASTEILLKASKAGLRIREVGIPITYNKGSTHNPVGQWLDVAGSTIKYMSLEHPLKFYGIPATLSILIGVFFGIWALDNYVSYHRLVTNYAIISLASTIMGLILGTTAIILFTMTSLIKSHLSR